MASPTPVLAPVSRIRSDSLLTVPADTGPVYCKHTRRGVRWAMLKLIYWPFLPGRGELVRLVLEEASAAYEDVARLAEAEGGGAAAVREHLYGEGAGAPGFAPPFLIDGDLKLAQMPAVCAYLGDQLRLAPEDPGGRARTLQLMLSVADVLDEAHATHHPVGTSLTYEEQKAEALQAARLFREQRLPRWLSFFERVLATSGGDFLVGEDISYADLGLFQLVEGLLYAFPVATAAALRQAPRIAAHREGIARRPRIAEFRASDRHVPFNNHGIFRRYPELDTQE